MKMCQRYLVFLLATLILQGACTRNDSGQGIVILDPPPTVPVTDGTGTGQGSGSPSDQSGVTITDIDFPSNPSNDPPFTSIPAELVRSGSVLAFSQDSAGDGEQFNTVLFGPNVFENPGRVNRVIMSTNELPPPPLPASVDVQLTAPISGVINHAPTENRIVRVGAQFIAPFIRSAHAQEIVINPPVPGAQGIDGRCAQPGTVCCPVNTNGAFECSLRLTTASVSQLYIATISSDGRIGPSITEPVQERLPYLGAPVQDIASGRDGSLYAVTESNIGVDLQSENNIPRVLGRRTQNYQSFDPQGATQMAFAGTELTIRRPTQGITRLATTAVANPGTATSVGNPLGTVTVPGVQEYTTLKLSSDGKLRFGVRNGTTDLDGKIYMVNANPESDRIFFSVNQDDGLIHRRTLAFDVDSNNCALVVFEDNPGQADQPGNVRLRVGCRIQQPLFSIEVRFGGTAPMSPAISSNDVVELVFYNTTRTLVNRGNAVQISGRALLVLRNSTRIWNVEYFVDTDQPQNNRITATLDPNVNGIAVGTQPSSIALNPMRTRAYVTNQGDDTVSVIALDDPAGPRVINTYNLRNAFQGNKEIRIEPNKIVYQDNPVIPGLTGDPDNLFIGSANLNGALIVPVGGLN